MRSYLIDALRSSVPQYTLDEVFDKKDAIASDVNQTVSGLMVAYGYDVVSTLITSIDLPADVEQSMNRINSAQREKEAAQSLAEAERIKVVTEARARAEAMEQAGRGIAAQRKAIADGISESLAVIKSSGVSAAEANQLFIFTQWTDMIERVRPQRPPVHRGAAERLHRRRPPCSSRCSWPRRRKATTSSSSWRKRRSSSFVTPLRASVCRSWTFPERRDNFPCAEGIGAIYCQIASKREMMQDHF